MSMDGLLAIGVFALLYGAAVLRLFRTGRHRRRVRSLRLARRRGSGGIYAPYTPPPRRPPSNLYAGPAQAGDHDRVPRP